ncbi:MAG: hypothetical protein GY706_16565 [Bacteroides sp.]|nr:hypothetical protein [Bacteroides sp.]
MNLFNCPEKTLFGIFLLLASLCILISSYGIYALVSYGWLLPLVFLLTCSIVMLAVARQVWVAIRQSPVNAIKE